MLTFTIGASWHDLRGIHNLQTLRLHIVNIPTDVDMALLTAAHGQSEDQSPYETYADVLTTLKENYYSSNDKQIDSTQMTYNAIRGMVGSLHDRYTTFMDPTAYQEMMEDNDGQFVGIGAMLGTNDANQVYVVKVLPGGPARKYKLMRVLPNHRDLAEALCAYDLVGFQTKSDLHGFCDYLLRWAGAEDLGHGVLRAFGRIVRAQVFPIGIDAAAVAEKAAAADASRYMRRLRQSLGERTLMIGVDRLDYSKGLPARFAAFGELLETYPETRGRIVFMQIAPPSRSEVPEYQEIRRTLAASAGHINGRYGEFDWTPLRYINKSFSHRVLTGFFRAARIGLVTPLRDGMNLVAKEYVASQPADDPGVLVLSCFAGAAQELGEAVLVNPHDIEGMADGIRQGLTMSLGERKERWTAMMATIEHNDITRWRETFVAALTASGAL